MIKSKNEIPPKIAKKKKIDINRFEKLAFKIKKYFEEEERYLEKTRKNGNSNSPGILQNS